MNKDKYFTTEFRIRFTGHNKLPNDLMVDVLSRLVAAFLNQIKRIYPLLKIDPIQDTTYSDEPLEVEVTTKKTT